MSSAKSSTYLQNKRATGRSNTLTGGAAAGSLKFKSSTSNLTTTPAANISLNPNNDSNNNSARLKSTSMSNLMAGSEVNGGKAATATTGGTRLTRPSSRSALDSIHNGMNARYANVQSKVLLQNIRSQALSPTGGGGGNPGSRSPSRNANSKIPARRSVTPSRYGAAANGTSGATGTKVPSDRTVLLNKLKAQQEEMEKLDAERQTMKQELEREKSDKLEQIQQLKAELQEKMQEHDKQNEEYHQKLLEAYELADQNRRAADSMLSESRQRDEESRKRIEELEQQLSELKEFVTMKEEMSNKMFELREQMRQERERYEEQLKSLHQVFEHEKMSHKSNSNNSMQHQANTRSNYFSRTRPNLESSESINEISQIEENDNQQSRQRQLNNGQQQMSKSQQDLMYGSKLSTRMQDTAKSAWKASRKFASSVITGAGGGLSACRKMGKANRSHKINGKGNAPTASHLQQVVPTFETCANADTTPNSNPNISSPQSIQVSVISTQPVVVAAASGSTGGLEREDLHDNCGASDCNDEEQHTSVIQVNSSTQRPISNSNNNNNSNKINCSSDVQKQTEVEEQKKQSLTIVTKFCDSDRPSKQANSSGQGSLTGSSERSRCESSSSGRGTSSDAGSAHEAELSGEETVMGRQVAIGSVTSTATSSPSPNHHDNTTQTTPSQVIQSDDLHSSNSTNTKRHRRKSSLFKASSILSGSQVSLNKVKCFFMGSSSPTSNHHQQQVSISNGNKSAGNGVEIISDSSSQQEQMESSRFRCLELNQALKAPLTSRTSTFALLSGGAHNSIGDQFEVSSISINGGKRRDGDIYFNEEGDQQQQQQEQKFKENNNEIVDKLKRDDVAGKDFDLKMTKSTGDSNPMQQATTNQQVGVPICAAAD